MAARQIAQVLPWHLCPTAEDEWRTLERTCQDCSPFLTWVWVRTWLDCVAGTFEPLLFRFIDRDGPVALGALILRKERGRGLSTRRVLRFSETGDEEFDELTIEYAALLCRDDRAQGAYARLFEALDEADLAWDQWRLSATLHASHIDRALPAGSTLLSTRPCADYSVALDELRARNVTFRQSLDPKTRRKLASAFRDYEKHGALRVDEAQDLSTAMRYFRELQRLHQAHWTAKGKPGAFGSRFFSTFHDQFLSRAFPENLVAVTRISVGEQAIGYKYNLRTPLDEYGYLTGVNYELLDGRNQPGFVLNACVIEAALQRGARSYRLMTGDQNYKKVLGTHRREVRDVTVFRRGIYGKVESRIRRLLGRAAMEPLPDADGTSTVDRPADD